MKVRAAESCSRTVWMCGFGLLLFFLLGTLPGYAQVSHETSAKHEQELRQSLKEASQLKTTYKDTHLNTDAYTFKKGAAGRRRVHKDNRDEYQFNMSGEPVKKRRLFKKKRQHKQRDRRKRDN